MVIESKNFVIKTADLTKIFRDFWGNKRVVAVDSLDLEIYDREVYGLLGPNGSGKSTTIKMLLGLLFPSRGLANVLSRPPGGVKTNARIGYLPEDSHLYPFLNAHETLDFYGRLFGLPRPERRRRIDSLLDMVGLAGIGHRSVGEFSKGMARRIGLAQALINDPDLLILDEPTSGLDPIGTRQIKDLISQLGRRGKTVLLCSHLLADVEDVCDRIGILYGGRMQEEGPVDKLLARAEMTQIRTNRLDPGTIESIKNIIRDRHHDYQVDIQTPRDRLEDYFLRIVAQAQAEKIETSGAVMGQGVSDFLSAAQTEESRASTVIEQLVATGEPQPVASDVKEQLTSDQVSTALPVKEDLRRDVLDTLAEPEITPVIPKKPSEAPTTDLTTKVTPITTPDEDIDHSVIDSLISDKSKDPRKPDDTSPQDQEKPDQPHR